MYTLVDPADRLTIRDRLFEAIRYAMPEVAYVLLNYGERNGRGDYLDIATNGMISWLPLNRRPNDVYAPSMRVRGKPAKSLKSFLPEQAQKFISDPMWESFSHRFLLALEESKPILKIVSGKDIVHYYNENNQTTTRHVSPLSNSCMRYPSCGRYLELYEKNPDRVQMLVELDKQDRLIARALIWHTDQGMTFMDRIYGDNLSVELFKEFASENGWATKAYNTYSYPNQWIVNGEQKRRYQTVTLDYTPRHLYPYLDTFMFLDRERGILSNSKSRVKDSNDAIKLRRTDGSSCSINSRY